MENKTLNISRKILCSIILCILLFYGTTVEGVFYSSSTYHYSFSVPNDWEEIPKSIIDEQVREIARLTQAQFIDYTTGFELKDTQYYFEYPYVLVGEHEFDTPSYSEIMKMFNDESMQGEVEKVADKYSELIKNATINNPYIDKERNIIFFNIEMDAVDGSKIKGLIAMFLGKHSIIQLNFYSIKKDYLKNLSIFNQTIDSFKFEPAYAYSETEAKANDPRGIFDGVSEAGISGFGAGLLIVLAVLILSFFPRLKKKFKERTKNR